MDTDTDVLILGAGPVGLTLAIELARRGIRPQIVDKAPAIREVSKAMILHVRTQEVLGRLGIAERARAEAQALTEVVVHAYGKHVGSWDLDRIDSEFPHPLILGQNRTQHLLLERLAELGVQVQWNCEATTVELAEAGATAALQLRNPQTGIVQEDVVHARYLVGCEGSNSVVRKALGLTFEGDRYTGEQFIQADCRIRWGLPSGRSYLFLTAAGYLMVIEFPNDVVRIFISLPDTAPLPAAGAGALGAVESTSEVPTLDEIRDNLVRLTGYECELSAPVWLARYRTSHRYANRFAAGRAFIAGDAAHVHVPIGGQGMNTGIQDAFNLGWKLAGVVQGHLKPSVLDSYDAERHPVAESLIKGTDFAYKGILHPGELRQHAARWFGPFLIANPRIQSFMRDTLEELKVFYPDSELNLDLGGASGPAPGERVLDCVLVRAGDWSTVSLSAETRHPQWTLLMFGGTEGFEAAPIEALRAQATARFGDRILSRVLIASAEIPPMAIEKDAMLLDALGIAHSTYGVAAPAFYLLRPDTYVCARGPMSSVNDLLDHLALIFN